MQKASSNKKTSMAAFMGADLVKVEDIISNFQLKMMIFVI